MAMTIHIDLHEQGAGTRGNMLLQRLDASVALTKAKSSSWFLEQKPKDKLQMNPRPPLLLGIHVLQMSETTRDNPSYCRSSCTRKNVADCSTGMYDKLKTYKLWVQVVIISCIILALL